ncbi:MAG: hypothetical protein ACREV2_18015, partial [Burkholderiales bacterium]
RRHLLPGASTALLKLRNAALAWRIFAAIVALGSALLLWFGIPAGFSSGLGPLAENQAAFACWLFLSSVVFAAAQPHRARQWFWLFSLAPSGLLLLGMLLFGRADLWPVTIGSALVVGVPAAALGVYVGRKVALVRARNVR